MTLVNEFTIMSTNINYGDSGGSGGSSGGGSGGGGSSCSGGNTCYGTDCDTWVASGMYSCTDMEGYVEGSWGERRCQRRW